MLSWGCDIVWIRNVVVAWCFPCLQNNIPVHPEVCWCHTYHDMRVHEGDENEIISMYSHVGWIGDWQWQPNVIVYVFVVAWQMKKWRACWTWFRSCALQDFRKLDLSEIWITSSKAACPNCTGMRNDNATCLLADSIIPLLDRMLRRHSSKIPTSVLPCCETREEREWKSVGRNDQSASDISYQISNTLTRV